MIFDMWKRGRDRVNANALEHESLPELIPEPSEPLPEPAPKTELVADIERRINIPLSNRRPVRIVEADWIPTTARETWSQDPMRIFAELSVHEHSTKKNQLIVSGSYMLTTDKGEASGYEGEIATEEDLLATLEHVASVLDEYVPETRDASRPSDSRGVFLRVLYPRVLTQLPPEDL